MKSLLTFIITLLFSLVVVNSAFAQKGMGDETGIARQGLTPVVVNITGELLEIKSGPCENSTGKGKIGIHLILQKKGGQRLNIHLGPESAVDHVVEQLVLKQQLSVDAFHTEKMPDNAYIAKSISINEKVIHLRDENLRPSWAYPRGSGQGMGKNRQGNWGRCW